GVVDEAIDELGVAEDGVLEGRILPLQRVARDEDTDRLFDGLTTSVGAEVGQKEVWIVAVPRVRAGDDAESAERRFGKRLRGGRLARDFALGGWVRRERRRHLVLPHPPASRWQGEHRHQS